MQYKILLGLLIIVDYFKCQAENSFYYSLEADKYNIVNCLTKLDSLSEVEISTNTKVDLFFAFQGIQIDSNIVNKIKRTKISHVALDFENCIFPDISIISGMPSLYSLSFAFCDIGTWYKGISSCHNIEHFQIQECKLNDLPEDFSQLEKLTSLKIKTSVQHSFDVSNFSRLEEMEINIPDTLKETLKGLCNLKRLKHLLADWYSPIPLPECLGELDSLTDIYLGRNIPPKTVYENKNISHVYISPCTKEIAREIISGFNKVNREVSICINNNCNVEIDSSWVTNKKIKLCTW